MNLGGSTGSFPGSSRLVSERIAETAASCRATFGIYRYLDTQGTLSLYLEDDAQFKQNFGRLLKRQALVFGHQSLLVSVDDVLVFVLFLFRHMQVQHQHQIYRLMILNSLNVTYMKSVIAKVLLIHLIVRMEIVFIKIM